MAKIFSVSGRAGLARAFEPLARALLRAGVPPDAVTVAGMLGVLVGALLASQGWLIAAVVVVTLCALTDVIDGSMARMRERPSRFGALLDSTTDRISDGAVFAAAAYWLAVTGDRWGLVGALISLIAGQVVSYVKARAEGVGLSANVGLIERFERLAILGIGALLSGFGVSWGLTAAVWLLAALSVFTVAQRIASAYRQDRASR